ncbi:hypothetical protein [Sphaerochaeta pleomorpha]|nr:hypothetical protein [Sphaerochaeta pleomorpha]
MNVCLTTKKLQKQCSEEREMIKAFGQKMSAKIQRRLMELRAADSLADVSHVPLFVVMNWKIGGAFFRLI